VFRFLIWSCNCFFLVCNLWHSGVATATLASIQNYYITSHIHTLWDTRRSVVAWLIASCTEWIMAFMFSILTCIITSAMQGMLPSKIWLQRSQIQFWDIWSNSRKIGWLDRNEEYSRMVVAFMCCLTVTSSFFYYYAAFNAPCVGHKADESQARLTNQRCV